MSIEERLANRGAITHERLGLDEFRLGQSQYPGHRDEEFDQLALDRIAETAGMKALTFQGAVAKLENV